MQNKLYEQHKDCEMLVNYSRCNAHTQPSLCCATHTDRKGRPQWIDWIAKEDLDFLIEGMCCKVITAEKISDTIRAYDDFFPANPL